VVVGGVVVVVVVIVVVVVTIHPFDSMILSLTIKTRNRVRSKRRYHIITNIRN